MSKILLSLFLFLLSFSVLGQLNAAEDLAKDYTKSLTDSCLTHIEKYLKPSKKMIEALGCFMPVYRVELESELLSKQEKTLKDTLSEIESDSDLTYLGIKKIYLEEEDECTHREVMKFQLFFRVLSSSNKIHKIS
ncbi:hypothetical protein C9994_17795, partial [Marivirga lumbricoides]